MADDNIIQFPNLLRDAIDDEQWQAMQGEFYLDCYFAAHGQPAQNPEQLRSWLLEVKLFADTDSPFFRGWLVRRLSESRD